MTHKNKMGSIQLLNSEFAYKIITENTLNLVVGANLVWSLCGFLPKKGRYILSTVCSFSKDSSCYKFSLQKSKSDSSGQ